jgi:hypothetical protein
LREEIARVEQRKYRTDQGAAFTPRLREISLSAQKMSAECGIVAAIYG